MRDQGKFVTGNLMRHVVVMSLSGTLGLGFTFLVDFLALWWISQLRQEKLIAAVGLHLHRGSLRRERHLNGVEYRPYWRFAHAAEVAKLFSRGQANKVLPP